MSEYKDLDKKIAKLLAKIKLKKELLEKWQYKVSDLESEIEALEKLLDGYTDLKAI